MKKYLSLFLLMLCLPLGAATLPDNMYFRAMNDEMKRTQKELRVKGSPKPFFTAYKVAYSTAQRFSAQFGAPYDSFALPQTNLEAAVYIYAGDGKNNSSGFVNDAYYYNPTSTDTIPLSYDGLRRFLWRLTDLAYVEASNSYEKKEAYKRQKNIKDNLPDFSKSPKASYVKDIPAFPTLDVKQYQQAVNDLSLLGKQLPYLEHFRVTLDVSQQDIFFLDSEGDFYQYSVPSVYFSLSAALRNQAGYTENVSDTVPLVWGKDLDRDFMLEKTQQFLTRLQDTYAAKKPEPYLGPVLLEPKAAGGFFYYLFVRNANHSKSLLSAQAETDGTAGADRSPGVWRSFAPSACAKASRRGLKNLGPLHCRRLLNLLKSRTFLEASAADAGVRRSSRTPLDFEPGFGRLSQGAPSCGLTGFAFAKADSLPH